MWIKSRPGKGRGENAVGDGAGSGDGASCYEIDDLCDAVPMGSDVKMERALCGARRRSCPLVTFEAREWEI